MVYQIIICVGNIVDNYYWISNFVDICGINYVTSLGDLNRGII